jgi:hypothetical protein
VGEIKIPAMRASEYFGSLGIGRAYDSPVSQAYEVPFKFTGTIEKVTVAIGG